MTYIIAEPCVGLKDSACVDVCPVDCIYTRDEDDQYYISPDECIDCAACEPVCPVTAIFAEDAVPAEWQDYIAKNYDYFKNTDPAETEAEVAPSQDSNGNPAQYQEGACTCTGPLNFVTCPRHGNPGPQPSSAHYPRSSRQASTGLLMQENIGRIQAAYRDGPLTRAGP